MNDDGADKGEKQAGRSEPSYVGSAGVGLVRQETVVLLVDLVESVRRKLKNGAAATSNRRNARATLLQLSKHPCRRTQDGRTSDRAVIGRRLSASGRAADIDRSTGNTIVAQGGRQRRLVDGVRLRNLSLQPCATSPQPRYFVRATVVPSQSALAGFSSCCLQRSIISRDAASCGCSTSVLSKASIAAVKSPARHAVKPAS
jgi:hypothetical protein